MLRVNFQNRGLITLPEAAKEILSSSKEKRIFCFYGELGAGKTTLIKEICKHLGVTNAGSSPTFSLVNEYHTSPVTSVDLKEGIKNGIIFHFDLYRLKNETELFDIGYEEYLFSGNYCFIEWPELMEHLFPADVVKVKIQVKDNQRIISLS